MPLTEISPIAVGEPRVNLLARPLLPGLHLARHLGIGFVPLRCALSYHHKRQCDHAIGSGQIVVIYLITMIACAVMVRIIKSHSERVRRHAPIDPSLIVAAAKKRDHPRQFETGTEHQSI